MYAISVLASAGTNTPLAVARAKGNTEVVKLLEDAGAEKKKLLDVAAKEGDVDAIKRLLDEGAEINAVNSNGETPLYVAAEAGHAKAVELLLGRGAEIGLAGPDNAEKEGSPTSPLHRGAPPQEDEEAPAAPARN